MAVEGSESSKGPEMRAEGEDAATGPKARGTGVFTLQLDEGVWDESCHLCHQPITAPPHTHRVFTRIGDELNPGMRVDDLPCADPETCNEGKAVRLLRFIDTDGDPFEWELKRRAFLASLNSPPGTAHEALAVQSVRKDAAVKPPKAEDTKP